VTESAHIYIQHSILLRLHHFCFHAGRSGAWSGSFPSLFWRRRDAKRSSNSSINTCRWVRACWCVTKSIRIPLPPNSSSSGSWCWIAVNWVGRWNDATFTVFPRSLTLVDVTLTPRSAWVHPRIDTIDVYYLVIPTDVYIVTVSTRLMCTATAALSPVSSSDNASRDTKPGRLLARRARFNFGLSRGTVHKATRPLLHLTVKLRMRRLLKVGWIKYVKVGQQL